jgi:hypothetical protein
MADDRFEDALDGTRPRRAHDPRPVASAMLLLILEVKLLLGTEQQTRKRHHTSRRNH